MDAPPFIVLAALVVGILAGQHAGAGPSPGLLAIGGVGLAGAWFVGGRPRVAVAAVALAALGFACTTRALNGQARSTFAAAVARHDEVTVRGVLVNDPDGPRFAASVLVRARHRVVLAVASGDDAMRLRVLQAGDHVTLTGRAVEVDGRTRWQHAVAQLVDVHVEALRPPTRLLGLADRLRSTILRGTEPLAATPRALVAGFLLGDRRDIPEPITAAYRDAGLSHLLAVSGENVAFVLALAAPVLRRLRLGARTGAALAIILVFAAMTRFEPSVLRASVMAAIAVSTTFVGRPASRPRTLAFAVTVLLVVDPFLLHSVAFLLSCGASAGITFVSPAIGSRIPGPRVVVEPLAVSVGAQLGVMPVLLVVFGSIPIVSPLTNLVAAPAAAAIGSYGFLACGTTVAFAPLGPMVHAPTALLVGWINVVARAGAGVPIALTTRGALVTGALAGATALRRPARRRQATRRR